MDNTRFSGEKFQPKQQIEPTPQVDVVEGDRIRLINMDDPYSPVEPGTEGTVRMVDDLGTVHVNWDNGRTLGVVPDVDEYELIDDTIEPPMEYNDDEIMEAIKEQKSAFNADKRDKEIGKRNGKITAKAKAEEEGYDDEEDEEDYNPYDGKERRFRVQVFMDIHVPMTANLQEDRVEAEKEASEVLKKLNYNKVSNVYLGGVAHNPWGTMMSKGELDRMG